MLAYGFEEATDPPTSSLKMPRIPVSQCLSSVNRVLIPDHLDVRKAKAGMQVAGVALKDVQVIDKTILDGPQSDTPAQKRVMSPAWTLAWV